MATSKKTGSRQHGLTRASVEVERRHAALSKDRQFQQPPAPRAFGSYPPAFSLAKAALNGALKLEPPRRPKGLKRLSHPESLRLRAPGKWRPQRAEATQGPSPSGPSGSKAPWPTMPKTGAQIRCPWEMTKLDPPKGINFAAHAPVKVPLVLGCNGLSTAFS